MTITKVFFATNRGANGDRHLDIGVRHLENELVVDLQQHLRRKLRPDERIVHASPSHGG